jgi:hypothetical protein
VTEDRPAGGTLRTPGKARHVILSSRTLLIIAVLFSGLLAGGNIDRSLVAMPAWQEVGVTAWTEFSRHADLANGLILYPLEALAEPCSACSQRSAFILTAQHRERRSCFSTPPFSSLPAD